MHERRGWVLLGLLVPLFWAAGAGANDPQILFEKYTLDNGMEVILHRDSTVPLVAVNVWYHVGSGSEQPGKSGFAHLFEHMMFQGSQHTGKDVHFQTLTKVGATGINGTTNTDRTNYFEIVPAHQLETALWLESDRMGYLLPLLTKESFANQQEVVRNERRQNYDNVPYGKDRFAVARALYGEGHPYRYLTIGRHEDLARATIADVTAFFRKWYAPANATLVLAGDFDPVDARRLVNKWFGSFPQAAKPQVEIVEPTPVTQVKRVEVSDPFASLRRVHYAWHTPALLKAGDAEMDVLARVLGDEGTGRLYKILVHDQQLAQAVHVYQASAQFSSTFNIIVDLKPIADIAAVEAIVNAELDKIHGEGISDRELKRAVTNVEAEYIWRLEGLNARANLLQLYSHYTGNPEGMAKDLDRYRQSSAAKVKAATRQYLDPNHFVEIVTVPGATGKGAGQ